MASPAPCRPQQGRHQQNPAIAGMHLTNTHLEASFHDRSALDLAAWLIPASFKPPTTTPGHHHHHHQQQHAHRAGSVAGPGGGNDAADPYDVDPSIVHDERDGTLRVAPKRLYAGMDSRVAPTARWVVDAMWLVLFCIIAAAFFYLAKSVVLVK